MKGSKGDGGKQAHQKSGSSGGDTSPLFPRLHVNQTEKAGPRAPPRNKMALYEQFTIPSQRFVPSNQTPPATSYQQQFPYFSYYMPASMQYANSNHNGQTYVLPSFGTGNAIGSGSVVVNEESQRVPSAQTMENFGQCTVSGASAFGRPTNENLCHSSVRRGSGSTQLTGINKSALPKKGLDERELSVSKMSFHRALDTPVSKAMDGALESCLRHDCSNGIALQMSIVKETPSCVNSMPGTCTTSEPGTCTTLDVGIEGGSFDEAQTDDPQVVEIGTVKQKADKGYPGQAVGNKFLDEKQSEFSTDGSQGEVCAVPVPERLLPTTDTRMTRHCTASEKCLILSDSGKGKMQPRSLVLPVQDLGQSSGSGLETQSCRDDVSCERLQEVPQESNIGSNAAVDTIFNSSESPLEPENSQNGKGAILELSQCTTERRTGSNNSDMSVEDSVSDSSIRPKDVIHAVGQQKFWKARKAILRQQRIFSDQVFELHKLIRVQQLLAETPNIQVDEDGDMADLSGSDAIPDVRSGREEGRRSGFVPNEVRSGLPSHETGLQPGIPYGPGWFQARGIDPNSQACVGGYPSMPAFIPGGMSAWGFPSLGVPAHCITPMAGQVRPFVYQPFAGNFTHGSAAFGSVSVPFGFPRDERSEFPDNTLNGHGHVGVSGSQCLPPMCHNSSPDVFGSWYAMQQSYLNHNQMLLATNASNDIPSTGSVASINNQPELSVHSIKTPRPPDLPYQWVKGKGVGNTGVNGLQSQESAPSMAIKTNDFASTTLPTANKKGYLRHTGKDLSEGLDSSTVDGSPLHVEDVNRPGRRDTGSKEGRGSKGLKEGRELLFGSRDSEGEMDADFSPDRSLNALNLFPLVPSLSPNERNEVSEGRHAEWHGRVIKVVPRRAVAASESAAGILLSIQQERRQ